MKTITIFLILIANSHWSNYSTVINNGQYFKESPCVSLANAEKVLGEPVVLLNNATSEKDGIKSNDFAFAAKAKDAAINTTGNLYVSIKQYPTAVAAHKAYADIMNANRNMAGQEKISLGDEGYFHTDGSHFYLFIFRKNKEMAVLKVNKITAKTSLPELRKLAEEMAARNSMMP